MAKYEEDKETFSADAYKIRGYEGVAWRVLGWDIKQVFEEYSVDCDRDGCFEGYDEANDEQCKKCDGTGTITMQEDEPTDQRTGMIVAVMVGDDRHFVLDQGDIIPITEDEYCHGCGQIGCTADGR